MGIVRTEAGGGPTRCRPFRVALVTMPFGSMDRPALGISLLKAGLAGRGLDCDVHYLFGDFADRIGVDDYRWLTDEVPYTSFAGDWCFTLPLYGRRPALDRHYVRHELVGRWGLPPEDVERIVRVREHCPAYIEHCVNALDWSRYDLVGFTSTFTQNIASLALAGRLRERFPALRTVFGGANWEGGMGEELHRSFPFVDYVCRGEADVSFPQLVEHLSKGERPAAVPGVLYRDDRRRSREGAPAVPVEDMDALPVPDFDDYFDLLARDPALYGATPSLLMETSRGCWWGAKSHCTFCGLNGGAMGFRSKGADRVLAELDALRSRWPLQNVSVVDNILDMKYFGTLLPRLAERGDDCRFFYEVKANLSREQIGVLARAGVRDVQPGIESLSTHVLGLMRKGTTALRNVQFLKWCRELGVSADWNILYGFPGERDEDHALTIERLRAISHLQPPSGFGAIRLDRFSPYHSSPSAHGLANVRAMRVFAYLYPFEPARRDRIAGYFDFDYAPDHVPSALAADTVAAIESWQRDTSSGELRVRDLGEALEITDTRRGRPPSVCRLEGVDRLVYVLCDRVSGVPGLVRRLEKLRPGERFRVGDLRALLDWLVERKLVMHEEGHYLALGVHEAFPVLESPTDVPSPSSKVGEHPVRYVELVR